MAWQRIKSDYKCKYGGIYWNGKTTLLHGRFRARFSPPNGKDQYGEHRLTKREAEADLEGIKKDYDKGGTKLLDAKSVTFAELAKAYGDEHLKAPTYIWSDDKRKQKKTSGVASYKQGRGAMNLFVTCWGDRPIKTITTKDIQRWIDKRQETKKLGGGQRTQGNINRTLDWLRQAFIFAVKEGYLTEAQKPDLSSLIDPDMEHQRERKLEAEEKTRLLAVANDLLKQVLILLLGTGLRPTEAMRLRREHVVLNQKGSTYGHIWLSAEITKTKQRRDVPIFTAEARQVIVERLSVIENKPDTLLFGAWSLQDDLKFDVACKAAGIDDFRLHDCRRTWASHAVNAMPMAHVLKYGGWSTKQDVDMLLRYVRTDQNVDNANVENFELKMAAHESAVESEQIN